MISFSGLFNHCLAQSTGRRVHELDPTGRPLKVLIKTSTRTQHRRKAGLWEPKEPAHNRAVNSHPGARETVPFTVQRPTTQDSADQAQVNVYQVSKQKKSDLKRESANWHPVQVTPFPVMTDSIYITGEATLQIWFITAR